MLLRAAISRDGSEVPAILIPIVSFGMRVRTLNTGSVISSRGTIRGGSFLSAVHAATALRRWILTAGPLPSLSC